MVSVGLDYRYCELRFNSYNIINVKKLQFIHTVNGDGSKTAKS